MSACIKSPEYIHNWFCPNASLLTNSKSWYLPGNNLILTESIHDRTPAKNGYPPPLHATVRKTFEGPENYGFTFSCVNRVKLLCPPSSPDTTGRSKNTPSSTMKSSTSRKATLPSSVEEPLSMLADTWSLGHDEAALKTFCSFSAKGFREEYRCKEITAARFEAYIAACSQTSGPNSIQWFLDQLSEPIPQHLQEQPVVASRIRRGTWTSQTTYECLVDDLLDDTELRKMWAEQDIHEITEPQEEAFMRHQMHKKVFLPHLAAISAIKCQSTFDETWPAQFPKVLGVFDAIPACMQGLDDSVKAHLRSPALLMEFVDGWTLDKLEEVPHSAALTELCSTESTLPIISTQEQADNVLREALELLHTVWNFGMTYSDWAPNNIMKTSSTSLLVDLGGFRPLHQDVLSKTYLYSTQGWTPEDVHGPDGGLEAYLIANISSCLPGFLRDPYRDLSFATGRFGSFNLCPRTTFIWQVFMQAVSQKALAARPWSRSAFVIELLRACKSIMNDARRRLNCDIWHESALISIRKLLLQHDDQLTQETVQRLGLAIQRFERLLNETENPMEDDFWLPTKMLCEFGCVLDGEWTSSLDTANASVFRTQLQARIEEAIGVDNLSAERRNPQDQDLLIFRTWSRTEYVEAESDAEVEASRQSTVQCT